MLRNTKLWSVIALSCLLTACGDSRERVPWDAPGFVKGKAIHPTVKIGVPYKVMGKRYYPKYDPTYDEIGLASWYGPNFHGKSTANGERYNQWAMTAAHKTLPMPSIVRVTHQNSGKSIIVRINDRGPFADGRIIDLSRAAAEELGTVREGVAKVRVEYLKEATEQYIAKLNLKKPDEWKEFDMAFNAKSRTDVSFPTTVSKQKDVPKEMVKSAAAAPDLYVENNPKAVVTTLDVRGVEMQEVGYAQDAFTVLEAQDYHGEEYIPPHQDKEQQLHHKVTYKAPEPQPKKVEPVSPVESKPLLSPKLYIQAGSFGSKENAMGLAEKLSEISAIEVETVAIGDNKLFRVLLGPTLNRETAEELSGRLPEFGIKDARIIRK